MGTDNNPVLHPAFLDKAKAYVKGPLPYIGLVTILGFLSPSYLEVPGWAALLFVAVVFFSFVFLLIKYPTHLYPPGDYDNSAEFRTALAHTALRLAKAEQVQEDESGVNADLAEAIPFSLEGVPKQDKWKRRILWVDDKPENNRFERIAFEQAGIRFHSASSTDEALALLNRHGFRYGAVISDFSRRQPRAGYELLDPEPVNEFETRC